MQQKLTQVSAVYDLPVAQEVHYEDIIIVQKVELKLLTSTTTIRGTHIAPPPLKRPVDTMPAPFLQWSRREPCSSTSTVRDLDPISNSNPYSYPSPNPEHENWYNLNLYKTAPAWRKPYWFETSRYFKGRELEVQIDARFYDFNKTDFKDVPVCGMMVTSHERT